MAWLFLWAQPCLLFSDYVMMCTFFENPEARVFNVSDEGSINYEYSLTVTQGASPESLVFSRNGKCGLVGVHTTYYPPTHIITVLGVDNSDTISVLGTVHNENEILVAISPDSKYGVYGRNLQTLRFNSDNTYELIPTENPNLSGIYGDFSSLSGNLITNSGYPGKKILEFTLLPDGRTTATGVVVDISPSPGFQNVKVSPDGKTCIVLSIAEYNITSLRVNESGGFSIAQQFHSQSSNPFDIGFTPDSKYVLISFIDDEDGNIRSFQINEDSTLTLVDAIVLPYYPGEDMAVTPDGKFAITRGLIQSKSYFDVVRIHEDGTLEYLPEKGYIDNLPVSDMEFVPPQITAAGNTWLMY